MSTSGDYAFVNALMQYIVADLGKIPKAQVERAVGPILGLFLEQVFSKVFQDAVQVICPEFPLRKPDSNQSTNLDWLLYAKNRDQFLFVELKTTDTTYREDQADIYREAIKGIETCGAARLIEDVKSIKCASSEWGKYENVLSRVEKTDYRNCTKAALVYLVPKCSLPCPGKDKSAQDIPIGENPQKSMNGQVVWLSFEDLPKEIDDPFAHEWRVVRKWLVQLDATTRDTRNGMVEGPSQRNFAGRCCFEELIRLCAADPDGIVVGFEGGTTKLSVATLDQLESRSSFKWDHANHATGRKDGRNWIPGREFLAIVDTLRENRPSPLS
jgi:hypothetical protein